MEKQISVLSTVKKKLFSDFSENVQEPNSKFERKVLELFNFVYLLINNYNIAISP